MLSVPEESKMIIFWDYIGLGWIGKNRFLMLLLIKKNKEKRKKILKLLMLVSLL
jgi:hypothetical protein